MGPLNEASERARRRHGPPGHGISRVVERLGRPWNDAAMKGTHGGFGLLGRRANNLTTMPKPPFASKVIVAAERLMRDLSIPGD